jgi:hypothetical protein
MVMPLNEAQVEINISHLKPQMKVLRGIDEIKLTSQTIIQTKVDGEFTLLRYERNGQTFTVNQWGHLRTDFPALNEFKEAISKMPIQKAELLCELCKRRRETPETSRLHTLR